MSMIHSCKYCNSPNLNLSERKFADNTVHIEAICRDCTRHNGWKPKGSFIKKSVEQPLIQKSHDIVLRDYQQEAVDAIWEELFEEDSSLCVLPTGTGKTEIMICFLKRCIERMPDIRSVTLVNKVNLLEQTHRRFAKALGGEHLGMFCGSKTSYRVDQAMTVASIQSIYDVPLEKLNLIILDEVHNVNQEDGRYFNFIELNKKNNPKLKIVAFTATPFRATGYIYGEGKLFKRITYRKHLPEMIAQNYLVKPSMKRVDHQFDTSKLHVVMGEYKTSEVEKLTGDEAKVRDQIKDALPRMEGKKKVVWACSSINHCELVNRILNEFGESSVALHSKLSDDAREDSIKRFEVGSMLDGIARHMVFVSIVSEGYDYPPIDCVVLMRPMRSPVLYVQTVGRGLRPSPGKDGLLVLDYGKVVESCGPLDNPIMVEARDGKKKKPIDTGMKFCKQCLEYVEKETTVCPVCGYVFEKPSAIQKLDHRASYSGELLSKKLEPVNFEVGDVWFEKYRSKSGNECLKINYTTTSLTMRMLSEYFVWTNEWAVRRLQQRLVQLGAKIRNSLEEQAQEKPSTLPSEIVVIQEKYPKIVKLVFGSRDNIVLPKVIPRRVFKYE